jgi:hypothetical protein
MESLIATGQTKKAAMNGIDAVQLNMTRGVDQKEDWGARIFVSCRPSWNLILTQSAE